MENIIRFFSILFLVTFMFWTGLVTERGEILERIRHTHLFNLGLIANFLLVPLWAWILERLLQLPPGIANGFLILGCTPGGLFALQFTRLAKGDASYAVASTLVFSLMAVVVTPLIMRATGHGKFAHMLLLRVMALLALYAVLPIILGRITRRALKMKGICKAGFR